MEEKLAIDPVASIDAKARSRWKRDLLQLNGKYDRNYIHHVSPLLMQSYSEIGEFPHVYHPWELPCSTHYSQSRFAGMLHMHYSGPGGDLDTMFEASYLYCLGVSALEFDAKGTHLASVTRSGCLTFHKFESLNSQSNEFDEEKNEKKRMQHMSLFHDLIYKSINTLRWNPSNQDEIAYTSPKNAEVVIFDIQDSKEVQVLSKMPSASVHMSQPLSDIAFFNDGTRVLASDTRGGISMWDRRASKLPQRVLTTRKSVGLTSIQLLGDQCVYGASESGFIHIWDLRKVRGGRSSAASQSAKEVHTSPLTSVNLESMLNEIIHLMPTPYILRRKEIHSININPSCPYQLGFHFNDCWSGVLDMHNYRVSHIHCPPLPTSEAWPIAGVIVSPPRKPSWLPEHSIYAVPSATSNGLHLVDFYPHPSAPCHVDYDNSKSSRETVRRKKSVFVPLSKRVTACAIHPLNDTIVAGTVNASLLTVSQKHLCKKGDGDDDDDDDEQS